MKVLSSAQARAEIEKLEARQQEIASLLEEKRTAFEGEDIEKRDSILAEVESLKQEEEANTNELAELVTAKERLEEEERKMELKDKLASPEVRKVEDKYDTAEYRSAYVKALKSGELGELRSLATTTAGVPVPTIMQGFVEAAWEKHGHIIRLVSKSFFKGILAVPYESAADAAGYHVEGAEANDEENLTLAQTLLQPAMIKKWIAITDELIAMTDEEFMRYVADEVIYNIILFLEKQIVKGAGTSGKGVIGIADAPLTVSVTQALNFNAVNVALGNLVGPVEAPVAIMNRKTFFDGFMGLTEVGGMPIFQIATDNEGRPAYYVNGVPVLFSSALPTYADAAANACWLEVGDLSGYRLQLPEGENVNLLTDPYTLAADDKVRLIGRILAGGNVVKPGMLAKVLKPAA